MFDLSVRPAEGGWVLDDDSEGRLGEFSTQAEALAAAGQFARVDLEPRVVLLQVESGEWVEVTVEPTSYH